MRQRLLSLLSILFFFHSCSTDPVFVDERLQKDVFVFGALSNTLTNQRISLHLIRTAAAPRPVENAEVTVTVAGRSFPFPYFGDGEYLEPTGELPIREGELYQLRIDIPGRPEITASFHMPAPPKIQQPSATDTLFLHKVASAPPGYYEAHSDMSWRDSEYAVLYRVGTQLAAPDKNGERHWSCLIPANSFTWQDFYDLQRSFPSSSPDHARIWVTALDRFLSYHFILNPAGDCFDIDRAGWSMEAFQQFESALQDSFPNGSINLHNARGVFGGMVTDSLTLPVKIEETNVR